MYKTFDSQGTMTFQGSKLLQKGSCQENKERPKQIHTKKTQVEGEFLIPKKKKIWLNFIPIH